MHTVLCAFEDRTTAERAVERLVNEGFDREDIHVEDREARMSSASTTTTAAGEPVHEQGVFASISHFFSSLFGDDDDRTGPAGTYSEAVRRGSAVVVVDTHDETQAQRASSLMHELGAYDVDERAQHWRAQGWTGYDAQQADTPLEAGRDRKLDVVQEELQVGKRAVDRGGVRIVQRVSQQPVRELVRLREETAVVERHAVDRVARPGELDAFREGTIEIREMAEEPVVAKTARVVEEVSVGKQVREREETIEDTVRRQDVEVQRMEGGSRPVVEREDRAFAAKEREQREAMEQRQRDELGNRDKPR